jgi:RING finger protein 121
VSLAGLWLMPAIISLHLKFWRFLAIWAAYSAVTGYLISLCMGKKMHHATPRKVRRAALPQQHAQGLF